MPRKNSYRVELDDDDDEYDAYEDYDYDYDEYEEEETGVTNDTKGKQEIVKSGVWSCPICTYDNEDFMSSCDICGVLRNPLVKVNGKDDSAAVGGTSCKNFGTSPMAKSLFASLPQQSPKKAVLFQSQNDPYSREGHFNFPDCGNICGNFHEFHRAFSIQNRHKYNIAPFKFDVPSPDDLVSKGLRSVKLSSKDSFSTKETEIPIELESESSSISISRDRYNEVKEKKSAPQGRNKSSISDAAHQPSKSGKAETVNVEKAPSLNVEKAPSVNVEKVPSVSEYKPEAWMIPKKQDDVLDQLNLAIVGHVDSGKSTLSGRLLHLLGKISQKEMHKYEKEAKQQGKGSFAYAWALDESAEERERGITMTVAVAFFTSKKYNVVILDSPGHRDFVPNMISGATQADAAVLVIDASIGAFETGIDASGGQTREHAQLIRSFGVDQIIILVNKMDVIGYSKERFDVIKQKLVALLRSSGFKDSSMIWVPASAMENQNLIANPSDVRFSWFKGPHLLEAIDSIQLPARDYLKPLLMPIVDVVKSQSQGHVSACGKLETGAIRPGSKVLIMPSREVGIIRSLERDSKACSIARAGDNVTVNLQGIDGNRVTAGGVMCHPDYPIQVTNQLELKILVLDIKTPILMGSQLEFHIHHAKGAARIVKILSLLDPKTGKETKKSPRCLLAKQNAVIEVVVEEPVCAEAYSNCRALGRVSLRTLGKTVALGVVTRIVKREE